MSYKNRVELQREKNRRIEEQRKLKAPSERKPAPEPEPGIRNARHPLPYEQSSALSRLTELELKLRRLERRRLKGFQVAEQIRLLKLKIEKELKS